ncbi:DUF362 domain-containing protein [Candidatus Woesearchaeota archaeon]|nr:DUF362 domain-containing protein [Candidatus Woesearchaeota archaeon]
MSDVVITNEENLLKALKYVFDNLEVPDLKDKIVLIKPNTNTPDPPPGSTAPDLLDATIKIVKEFSPKKIIVGDKSMSSLSTIEVVKKIGIIDVCKENNVEFLDFDDCKWVKVDNRNFDGWSIGFSYSKIFDEVDYVISLVICKTHWTARFTMALKGQVGITNDNDREQLPHGRDMDDLFGQMVAEISTVKKPDLVIMDARKSFVEGGPNQGALKEAGLIVGSKDPIANDMVGIAILRMLGTTKILEKTKIEDLIQIKQAIKLKVGNSSIDDINLIGNEKLIKKIKKKLY